MGHEARRNSRMESADTPVAYRGFASDKCQGCGWIQQGLQKDNSVPHVVWSELFRQQLCVVCFRKSMKVYTRMAAVHHKQRSNNFYYCDGCGHFHRDDWHGDCRENSERFTDVPHGANVVESEAEV